MCDFVKNRTLNTDCMISTDTGFGGSREGLVHRTPTTTVTTVRHVH